VKYYVISDNSETLLGLRLAGIEGIHASSRKEVQSALNQCLNNPDIGILLVTEKLARLCADIVDEVKLHNKTPLLVEIPDRHGTGRAPDSITRYIREAIGVKL
jgi:V/A-type H+-transporting ATPase subunit F